MNAVSIYDKMPNYHVEVLSKKAEENDLVTMLISMIIPNTHPHTVKERERQTEGQTLFTFVNLAGSRNSLCPKFLNIFNKICNLFCKTQ